MEDESAGEDEGDGDIDRLTANINIHGSEDEITMAEYEMHRTHKKFVVRQLPSKGLSFQVWPAASALCWFLDEMYWHHPTIVTAADENTRISSCIGQDVGSINGGELNSSAEGTGMVGIAAALLGAHVTITDLPHVLPNIEFNASVNEEPLQASRQGGSVCVKALRWGEEEDVVEVGHNFDLILASDVVYHENLFDPLLLTLKWLLLGNGEKDSNPILLMAHLRRWKKDARFFKKAKKLFNVRVVHRHSALPGSRLGVIIYCFTNKETKIITALT
ncbi:hypothetical protein SUGI_0581020 [Cryptomeria japonica]|nr:hypothetical protein SUGI_0581020 [Cryptomeria japonica]